jgi:ADP-ribose pyrophosphatase
LTDATAHNEDQSVARSKQEILARGKHLQLIREGHWEYADRVRSTGVVAIIAVTAKQELVLTQQYRIPIHKQVIDLPAGLVGDIDGEEDEAFETAAQRELLEETGYRSDSLEFVFEGPLSAGMTTEIISFFLTRGARRVSKGGGDGTEEIRVHAVPLKKINAWLRRKATSRTMIDPKVYAALGLLSCR